MVTLQGTPLPINMGFNSEGRIQDIVEREPEPHKAFPLSDDALEYLGPVIEPEQYVCEPFATIEHGGIVVYFRRCYQGKGEIWRASGERLQRRSKVSQAAENWYNPQVVWDSWKQKHCYFQAGYTFDEIHESIDGSPERMILEGHDVGWNESRECVIFEHESSNWYMITLTGDGNQTHKNMEILTLPSLREDWSNAPKHPVVLSLKKYPHIEEWAGIGTVVVNSVRYLYFTQDGEGINFLRVNELSPEKLSVTLLDHKPCIVNKKIDRATFVLHEDKWNAFWGEDGQIHQAVTR